MAIIKFAGLLPILYIRLLHGSIGRSCRNVQEFDRKEAAYQLRTYRHKAYYSLDRDDGLGA